MGSRTLPLSGVSGGPITSAGSLNKEESSRRNSLNNAKVTQATEPKTERPSLAEYAKIFVDIYGYAEKKIGDSDSACSVTPRVFGDDTVKRYTLMNSTGLYVSVINWGATITSIRFKDKQGIEEDVVLGFDNLEGYQGPRNDYFGATIGRVAGIISNAECRVGRDQYYLYENMGKHHINGGAVGFDKVLWDSCVSGGKVIMTNVSPDRDQGYPGILTVQLSFELTRDNCLVIQSNAQCSKPSPISLTNSIYFNLAGHGSGPRGLDEHYLVLNADRYLAQDDDGVPSGFIREVGGTYYDLRVPRSVGLALEHVPGGGYDHTFCLTKGGGRGKDVTFAARLLHPDSGRFVEILTDQPALHVYTGNRLPDPDWRPPEPEPVEVDELEDLFKPRTESSARVETEQLWPRPDSILEDGSGLRPSRSELEALVGADTSDKSPKQETGSEESSKLTAEEEDHGTIFSTASVTEAQEYKDPCAEYLDYYKQALAADEVNEEEETLSEESFVPATEIEGKMGAGYRIHGAICLLPQEYPNAINIRCFPSTVLNPGEIYTRTTVYKFGLLPQRSTINNVCKQARI